MAISNTFKTPTMVINGVATPTNRNQWAKLKLSAEDYAKYLAAAVREEAIWAAAEAAGEIERKPIYETIGDKVHVVGSTTIFHSGMGVASDAEFHAFYQQFLDDPDLTWPA